MEQENKHSTPNQVVSNIVYELKTLEEYMKITKDKNTSVIMLSSIGDSRIHGIFGNNVSLISLLAGKMMSDSNFASIILKASMCFLHKSDNVQGRVIQLSSDNPLVETIMDFLSTILNDSDKDKQNDK
ncbi:hypothetical protein CLV62_12027 [Dysgonomonas alginatilytica]|uniref:Uncharacterized protein n=1 Tax=Dysgonomonas alginatilytica TaxID=1605892 RepID=A0A2V3PMY2_9BACT|nr:hypothetical protein [Dysgonomonas alginatilytica]PXV62339.1 hypothetical protein CLV62_12027 [Dysgonomonas alginatilytica]